MSSVHALSLSPTIQRKARRMHRRFLTVILAAMITGCGSTTPPAGGGGTTVGSGESATAAAGSGESKPAKKYRIAMIAKGASHDFWLSVWAGAKQAADEL